MLLKDFFLNVYVPRRLRGKSQNSVRLYSLCITQFSRTLSRDALVSDLTEDNVLTHLARRSKVSPATRNKELAELTAMWRLASQQKLIDSWPNIQSEVEPQRTPIAWLASEVHAIMRSAKKQSGVITGIDSKDWWTGLLRVLFDTGERISAITSLEWNWLQGEWITVKAEARKGKTRDRQYHLQGETIEILERIRKQTTDAKMVFPWPYCPTYIWNRYKKIVSEAGLPSDREHAFHAVRKTVGSAVYAAGLDPQDALDHSDRRTTQRYIDPRFSRERQASDIVAEFLANPDLRTKPDPIRNAS
jgi:integrase